VVQEERNAVFALHLAADRHDPDLARGAADALHTAALRELAEAVAAACDPRNSCGAPFAAINSGDIGDDLTRAAAVALCIAHVKRAWACFDTAALELASQRLTELGSGGVDAAASVHCRAALEFAAEAAGRGNVTRFDSLIRDARALGLAGCVVNLCSLRALVALQRDDVTTAVQDARQASRMARTEGILWSEVMANTVLARVRRATARPHLAMRIVSALERVAPPSFRDRVYWERALAGGELQPTSVEESLASATLGRLLLAARSGSRSAFAAAERDLGSQVSGFALWGREARLLAEALDANRVPADMAQELGSWCRGDALTPPLGLHGVAAADVDGGEHSVAIVVGLRGDLPRRVLAPGLPLFDGSDELWVAPRTTRPGRVETGVAVLALSAELALPEVDFFQSVYGFRFAPGAHQGPLKVLVHRMRELLSAAATLERRDGVLWLEPKRPFAVWDTRCSFSLNDRILKHLGALGRRTAQQLSDELGLPLRTAQLALRELVEDGACLAHRAGRTVEYIVEDTTFSEPTRY
jgi:hypothetical protein